MGDEPKGFHKQFAGMDNGHRGRQKGQNKRHQIVFCFAVHAMVPQLGATQIVPGLQHRESLCTYCERVLGHLGVHCSCEFPLLQLPREELSSLSTSNMYMLYLLFFFESNSWHCPTRRLLMLVKVRHMVIRFPISAGLSRSALLLGWTPALRGLEAHYGSAVGSPQPCAL